MSLRSLRVAAAVEACSLALLLLNLATVHVAALASALGPVHGCAYLIGIVLTFALTRSAGIRVLSLIPAVGALLVLRRLRDSVSSIPRL
ncbi:DUF3817 domain-containing protein [Kineosporia succinea]|uniref:DUF3817 domain-containing protein n=1 Tax=Kineosporia succinea TaxID=84632 RepID=A0ABT9P102_9ACTN|nr:DUF3817 domain-containing protein [Kineosporia succinea]MDP9826341.1 hypothetical protein [Kineosporia succinea]